ncbi:MAG: hypothetical protein L0287_20870, partial [Anaerolineae bacterium]|nr:hypothetical protein [Anaerolineae bacterium]
NNTERFGCKSPRVLKKPQSKGPRMDRREAIKGLLAALSVGAFAATARAQEKIYRYGAEMPSPEQRRSSLARPSFHEMYKPMKGLASAGKNVFLWKDLEKEIGTIEPHWQGPDPEDGSQGEGDCVGHASAMGCDVLTAARIHSLGKREKFIAKASVEMIYAGSRVEIGKSVVHRRGGSRGEWAANYLKDYGVLHRQKYQRDGNEIDLTGYSPARSRQYRDKGVPDWLETIAREHPVEEFTNPRTGMEALDAVCARQPVIVCSSYAFHDTRDDQGFCMPYLGRGRWDRVQWWHAMILTGALMEGDRIGGLIQNSHGEWNSGPRPHDIPVGSFFVDVKYLDLMIQDWYDCWALASYKGHEAAAIKHKLFWR